MRILTRSEVEEGGKKSTLRREKKVSREADLNHRPKDDYEHATTVLRSTNWAITGSYYIHTILNIYTSQRLQCVVNGDIL